jgi:hypothetical protein
MFSRKARLNGLVVLNKWLEGLAKNAELLSTIFLRQLPPSLEVVLSAFSEWSGWAYLFSASNFWASSSNPDGPEGSEVVSETPGM